MVASPARKASWRFLSASLLLVPLPGVGASRLSLESAGGAATGSSGPSWSPWNITLDGMSCLDVDPEPFNGIKKDWPECFNKMKAEARKLASSMNCKVCDVNFLGSKPEAEMGLTSTKCKATVTCAAGRLPASQACIKSHGALMKVEGLNKRSWDRFWHPNKACLPCPQECKACIYDKSVTNRVIGRERFKCVLDGGGGASGAICEKPTGVECGECSHRRCRGMLSGVMGSAFCDTNDWKTLCKWPAEFAVPSDPADWSADEDLRQYELRVKSGLDSRVLPPVLEKLA